MGRPNSAVAIAGHIQGLREAKAAFQALPAVVREGMLAAVETTAQEIARQARSRIQSSPSIQTKTLLNSIGYKLTKTSGRAKVGVGNGTSTVSSGGKNVRVKGRLIAGRGGSALKSMGAKLIRPSRYAHLVEFGSRKMAAEPFMLPSARAQAQPFLDRCIRAGKAIETNMAAVGARTL